MLHQAKQLNSAKHLSFAIQPSQSYQELNWYNTIVLQPLSQV